MLYALVGAFLTYPKINPILFHWGPFVIRWYGLAYIFGLIFGWYYIIHLINRKPSGITRRDIDDFIMWATLGIILGGRIGYVLFYNLDLYMAHPLEIFRVWDGGMSFHGGLLGTALVIILFTRSRGISFFRFSDLVACAAPIGLFLGRLANFVNGELWGRPTDVPWAMVFPGAGPEPRHPSELYEAGLEGILLFLILWYLVHKTKLADRPGVLTGVFLIGYSMARIFAECFREPDPQLGFLYDHLTMGQLLSIPMLVFGIFVIVWRLKARPNQGA